MQKDTDGGRLSQDTIITEADGPRLSCSWRQTVGVRTELQEVTETDCQAVKRRGNKS